MGPPIFIGGNPVAQQTLTGATLASMGPPIFIGGNNMASFTAISGTGSFNGAADFHRRKST